MSKRMKVLVSVLVTVLLLTVGGVTTVMAQDDEPTLTPEPSTKIFMMTANTTGLLARVAEIMDIPEEDLVNAFKQARQEMRQEAFFTFLDELVEEGRLTQEEADEIKEWLENKPEALDQNLLRRAFGFKSPGARQMPGLRRGMRPGMGQQPWQGMELPPGQEIKSQLWQEGKPEALNQMSPRARIFKAVRGRHQIAVPGGWNGPIPYESAE